MVKILGFQFGKTEEPEAQKPLPPSMKAVVADSNDGSVVVEQGTNGGWITGEAYSTSTSFDVDPLVASEHDLITRYRDMAMVPEIEQAIDHIINEMVAADNSKLVNIDLSNTKLAPVVREKIRKEFDHVMDILKFHQDGFELIKRWYVDGRLTFQCLVDPVNYRQEGIQKLVYLDPRLVKKVRVVRRAKDVVVGTDLFTTEKEYFLFSETGFNNDNAATPNASTGVRMTKEAVVQITSGIYNSSNKVILSHLHKAIRPLNQLKSLEDASIIYRLARAPERRIFYIDVGGLPPAKAEQQLRRQMQQYKSKMVYDSASGTMQSDNKQMTMVEDYWLPRNANGKATEITTLPGGQNLGEMTEVNYFLQKLFRALNVPVTRLDPQAGFTFGRVTEISRDEVTFMKFVGRLRKRFTSLFTELLRRQLILKNICSGEEFDQFISDVEYEFETDNFFEEAKQNEILDGRLKILAEAARYSGFGDQLIVFSRDYLFREVLRFTDEEITEMKKQIDKEESERPEIPMPMDSGPPQDDSLPEPPPAVKDKPPAKPEQAAKEP